MSFSASIEQLVARSKSPLLAKAPGWSRVSLGTVARIINGFPFKSEFFTDQEGVPVIRIRDVTAGEAKTLYRGPIPDGYWVEPGDIVIGMDGDFNLRVWSAGKALLNQRVCKVVVDGDKADKNFVAHVLPGYLRTVNEATHSITVKHLSSKTVCQIPLPFPPLEEQRRIVNRLDNLVRHSNNARGELDRIPRLVERYKRSILAAAFRGGLTSDWRKHHPGNVSDVLKREGMRPLTDENLDHLPKGWAWVAAGTLCVIKSGITLGKKRQPGTVLFERPYLRVANVQRGWLNLDEIKTIPVTEKEAESLYLQPGDVLMNEGGDRDKLGRGWVWDGQIKRCIHQNHVFRLRPRIPELPSRYLSYYANEFGQNYFLRAGKQTTNLASISMSKISALPVPIAPADEMARIVALIEDGFAAIDKIATESSRASDLLDRLDQATLAKAFRGELV